MHKQSIAGCFSPPIWPGYEATVQSWCHQHTKKLECSLTTLPNLSNKGASAMNMDKASLHSKDGSFFDCTFNFEEHFMVRTIFALCTCVQFLSHPPTLLQISCSTDCNGKTTGRISKQFV